MGDGIVGIKQPYQADRQIDNFIVTNDVAQSVYRQKVAALSLADCGFETRLDYDTRLDGNPVYVGKNVQGSATSSATWTIQRLSYDATSRLTRAEVFTGSWDGRAALPW